MIASIAVAVAVLAGPTVLVLGLLIVLGTVVAAMSDGVARAWLVRPPSA
jgi:hypothetical protein